ncbi:MAG: 5'-nucleotidase C-terminal domain-containing protein, partial [Bacteroidota bacterium]
GLPVASLRRIHTVDGFVGGDLNFAARLALTAEERYFEYSKTRFGVDPDEPLALVDHSFSETDFIRLVLHILLERTGSELAVLNSAFFRFDGDPFPADDDHPGFRKITVRALEQVLWPENELVSLRLSGQQIAALQRMDASNRRSGVRATLEHLQVTTHGNADWYIHNSPPLQRTPPEFYRVVTSNYLAGGGDGFSHFRQGQGITGLFTGAESLTPSENGAPVVIRELVIRRFRELGLSHPGPVLGPSTPVDPDYLTRPLWRITLARLQINYAAGQYRNNDEYRGIGLTELRAGDFTRIMSEIDVRVRQDSRLFLWDNRLFAGLGQNKVVDQPLQEIADDIFLESILNLRASAFSNGISVYPSASFRYDTEFTPTESRQTTAGGTVVTKNPRQQDITLGLGAGLSDFSGFTRTRVSLTQTFDQTPNPRPDQNGINVQTMYTIPVGPAVLRSELDGTYYIRTRRSTQDTRRLLVRFRSDLAIPLGNLVLAPSVNLLLFQGQNSPTPGVAPKVATALVVGITVGFSRDWKLQYESLF